MAFFDKEYKFVKHENFDGYLQAVGLPADKATAIASFKSTVKITKNGDSYTITQLTPRGVMDTNFKSGVEFDDTIGLDNSAAKTCYTVDGNTVTQTIKSSYGTVVFKRDFSGDDLVVTITGGKFDGVAKIYYKA